MNWLFSTEPFVPHGVCVLRRPDLVRAHVVADAVIALASFNLAVVVSMLRVARRRIDDEPARGALDEVVGRVDAMGLVDQELYGGDASPTWTSAATSPS